MAGTAVADSSRQNRAANVCANCKARKKRCDKSLPRCRYCVEHDLPCQYHHTSQSNGHGRARSFRTRAAVGIAEPGSSLLEHHLLPVERTTDQSLRNRAQELLNSTGLYLDEISVRYFEGIHRFVPMVARRRFHAELFSFGGAGTNDGKADFPLLLLCMGLLVYYSADSPAEVPPQGQDDVTLYIAIKALLAQAQALCCSPPSLRLVQASVLLSVYEYAHGHPEQAFVSIGTCARLAYAARLRSPTLMMVDDDTEAVQEEINTWWVIMICERTFLCEVAVTDQPLASVMPGAHCRLPVEPSAGADSGRRNDERSAASTATSTNSGDATIHDALQGPSPNMPISSFGQAALAAWLVDRLLVQGLSPSVAATAAEDDDSDDDAGGPGRRTIQKLRDCDQALQSSLATIMRQAGSGPESVGRFCAPIALMIRGLFLLHGRVTSSPSNENDGHEGGLSPSSSSRATLDTATKMVVDIAECHANQPFRRVDRQPPSCMYIIRAALDHLDSGGAVAVDGGGGERELLGAALGRFERRWGVVVPGRH